MRATVNQSPSATLGASPGSARACDLQCQLAAKQLGLWQSASCTKHQDHQAPSIKHQQPGRRTNARCVSDKPTTPQIFCAASALPGRVQRLWQLVRASAIILEACRPPDCCLAALTCLQWQHPPGCLLSSQRPLPGTPQRKARPCAPRVQPGRPGGALARLLCACGVGSLDLRNLLKSAKAATRCAPSPSP